MNHTIWSSWQDFIDAIPDTAIYLGPWTAEKRQYQQQQMLSYIKNITNEPVDYFEFGVARGDSMDIACKVLQSNKNRLFGFDTFTGLPEDWKGRIDGCPVRGDSVLKSKEIYMPIGTFSSNGQTPAETGFIKDKRVVFIKGCVQDTLEQFLISYHPIPTQRKIINIDINLYSGALFILATMNRILNNGDIIMMDELYDVDGEFLAFNNYLKAFSLEDNIQCLCYDGKVFAFIVVK